MTTPVVVETAITREGSKFRPYPGLTLAQLVIAGTLREVPQDDLRKEGC